MAKTYGTIDCEGCGADHKTTQQKLGPPKMQRCKKCKHVWFPGLPGTPSLKRGNR